MTASDSSPLNHLCSSEADPCSVHFQKTPLKRNITEIDDFYAEMNKDQLFSMMVKYQKNKRYTAYLSRKVQKADLLE